jgi:hypothetical protein
MSTTIFDISFCYTPGSTLVYQIRRRADVFMWDFTNSIFTATPALATATLPEINATLTGLSGVSGQSGFYEIRLALAGLGAQFVNDDYLALVWDVNLGQYAGLGTITIVNLDARTPAGQTLAAVTGSQTNGIITAASRTSLTVGTLTQGGIAVTAPIGWFIGMQCTVQAPATGALTRLPILTDTGTTTRILGFLPPGFSVAPSVNNIASIS